MADGKATFRIDIDARGAKKGASDYERSIDGVKRGTDSAKKSIKDFSAALKAIGFAAAAEGLRRFTAAAIRAADTYQLLTDRLSLVTRNTQELTRAQESLFKIAQNTRSSFQSSVELYTRLARATKNLNVSQQQSLQVTETINKTIKISGATATSASAALFQLGQGLAAGALRGEELISVLEQTPRLAQAIADGLEVSLGKLPELGSKGQLTAEKVLGALLNQAEKIDKEFSKISRTFADTFTAFQNIFLKTVGEADAFRNAIKGIADILTSTEFITSFKILLGAVLDLAAGFATLARIVLGATKDILSAFSLLGQAIKERDISKFFEGQRKEVENLSKANKEFVSSDIGQSTKKVNEELQNLIKQTAIQNTKQSQLNAALKQSTNEYERVNNLLEFENKLLEAGGKFGTEQAEAYRQVFNESIRLKKEQEQIVDLQAKQQEQADEYRDKIEGLGDEIQSSLVDSFDDALRTGRLSFKDFFQDVLSQLRRFAAEAAASLVFKPVFGNAVGAIGGSILGFGGGGSALASAGGLGAAFSTGNLALGGGALLGGAGGAIGGISAGLGALSLGRSLLGGVGLSSALTTGNAAFAGLTSSAGLNQALFAASSPLASIGSFGTSLLLNSILGDRGISSSIGGAIGGIAGGIFGPLGSIAGSALGNIVGGLFGGGSSIKAPSTVTNIGFNRGTFTGEAIGQAGAPANLSLFFAYVDTIKKVNDLLGTELSETAGIIANFRQDANGTISALGTQFGTVQEAFSAQLRANILGGKVTGVAPALKRITEESTVQNFEQNLLAFVNARDALELTLEGLSKATNDNISPFEQALDDLNNRFAELRAQAKDYGVSLGLVNDAQQRQISLLRERRSVEIANEITSLQLQQSQAGSQFFGGIINPLQEFQRGLRTGDLSALSPQQQLQQAESVFRNIRGRALQGDISAIQQLPNVAQTFLQESRQFGASGDIFAQNFALVDETLSNIIQTTEQQQATLGEQLSVNFRQTVQQQTEELTQGLQDIADRIEDLRREQQEIQAA